MKTKISKTKIDLLVENFNILAKQAPAISARLTQKIKEKFATDQPIDPTEINELKKFSEPLYSSLREYTEGFPSFLRSVGKMEDSAKPSEEYLNTVRHVLQEARGLEEDLTWQMDHLNQKITLHNMMLGVFDISSPVPDESSVDTSNTTTPKPKSRKTASLPDQPDTTTI